MILFLPIVRAHDRRFRAHVSVRSTFAFWRSVQRFPWGVVRRVRFGPVLLVVMEDHNQEDQERA